MRTSTERKDGYAAKNVAATVSLKVASRLSGMKTGYSSAVKSMVPVEIAIRAILNSKPGSLPAPDGLLHYQNFARQIWSMRFHGIAGPALTVQAQALTDYYQAKGLDDTFLIEIANRCFGLVVT